MMEDEDLKKMGIVHYGDRIAIMALAKEQYQNNSSFVSKIKSKMTFSKPKKTTSDAWKSLVGNKNAAKQTRRINVGWLHTENGTPKQVKTQRGGGIRTLTVDIDLEVKDLLEQSVPLFFQHGSSKFLGPRENFQFSMRTYDHSFVEPSKTIGELYKESAFKLLTLYVCTEEKKQFI